MTLYLMGGLAFAILLGCFFGLGLYIAADALWEDEDTPETREWRRW